MEAERTRNIISGLREFIYSYSFFEFFINIVLDLSNAKKALNKGNLLLKAFLLFELVIFLTQTWHFISSIFEKKFEKQDTDLNQQNKKNRVRTEIAKVIGRKNQTNNRQIQIQAKVNALITDQANKISLELNNAVKSSFTLMPRKQRVEINGVTNKSKNLNQGQTKYKQQGSIFKVQGKQIKRQGISASVTSIFEKFELISDLRFAVIQIMICSLREPAMLQFLVIIGLQIFMTLFALIKLLFVKTEDSRLVEVGNVIQEVSITVFILLIVLLNNRSDMVQYLMVIALSIAIILELVIIMIEVVKDIILVILGKCKKRKNKNQISQKSIKLKEKAEINGRKKQSQNHRHRKFHLLNMEEDDQFQVPQSQDHPQQRVSKSKEKPKRKFAKANDRKGEKKDGVKATRTPRRAHKNRPKFRVKFKELKAANNNKKGFTEGQKNQ